MALRVTEVCLKLLLSFTIMSFRNNGTATSGRTISLELSHLVLCGEKKKGEKEKEKKRERKKKKKEKVFVILQRKSILNTML